MKTFNSTRFDGPMNTNPNFYIKGMTNEEIKEDFLIRREALGEEFGFDGRKIVAATQDLSKHKRGHYEDVTELLMNYPTEPGFDLWNLDIPADILLIRSELSGIVLAHPVADCPVVIANTEDVIALAHCGLEQIDGLLPSILIDVVQKETGARDKDINVYIGPHAKSKSYVYETYPKAAKNEGLWKHAINKKEDGYHISMKTAILLQLMARGVFNCKIDDFDTITNPNYYSHYAYKHGQEDKNGRFLVGAFFEPKVLTKTLSKRVYQGKSINKL